MAEREDAAHLQGWTAPRALRDSLRPRLRCPLRNYDVTRDGQTFVFLTAFVGRSLEAGERAARLGERAPAVAPPGKK